MLRMERLSWRALRSLLVAGAAATAWLTLSAPAASADAAPDSGTLLGGVSTSVSSVAEAAISPVEAAVVPLAIPDSAPADSTVLPEQPSSAEPAGWLQPLTGTVTGTVDHLVEAVPVVNQIVPSGTVTAATAPVIGAADQIVVETIQEVLPPASNTPPVLDAVVEPVSDLLTSVDSLQISVPTVRGDPEDAGGLPLASVMSKTTALFPAAVPGTLQPAPLLAGILEAPLPSDGSPVPFALSAVPGSGSGSSQSSAGGAGGTAWLSTFHPDVPLTGVFPVSGPLQNAPAPVSFDPGSSPD